MKQSINEVKRMQQLAGIINEDLASDIETDLEKVSGNLDRDIRTDLGKVSGQKTIIDPVKVKEVAKGLLKLSRQIAPDFKKNTINALNKIAVDLANNKLRRAASTSASLDENDRLSIWGTMDEIYPELWNTLFQEDHHYDYKITIQPGLPE